MKLYETSTAPNARRVRMFLAEKGVQTVEMVQMDIQKGENRSSDFQRKNPLMKVPVLELDDGTFLSESVAICRYFEASHPDNPLMGTSPLEQATIEMWQRRCEIYFMHLVGMSFQHTTGYFSDRMNPIPEWGVECGKGAEKFMGVLNQQLSDFEYVAGDTFSIADITAYVTVEFARVIKLRMKDEQTHLKRWYDQISLRDCVRA